MIEKAAFIMGYTGKPGSDSYCGGVVEDVRNYYNYFHSNNGGAWNGDDAQLEDSQRELFRVLDADKYKLQEYINYCNRYVEYVVLVFAGHGYYDKRFGTIIQLNNREEISVDEIQFDADRQLLILDCCRMASPKILREERMDKSISSALFAQSLRELYRKSFDRKLTSSAKGRTEIYSCSVGEASEDISRQGGLFSIKLLKAAQGNSNLSIRQAFNKAEDGVVKFSRGKQRPVFRKTEKGIDLPFYLV
jgi:hypothetical protein